MAARKQPALPFRGKRTGMANPGKREEEFFMSQSGTVKFFNATKGFGFIAPEGGDKDAFVHISAVERSGLNGLYEGDKVTYELETGRDGKISATNLTLVQ